MRSFIALTILACIEATAFADAKAEAKDHLTRAGFDMMKRGSAGPVWAIALPAKKPAKRINNVLSRI